MSVASSCCGLQTLCAVGSLSPSLSTAALDTPVPSHSSLSTGPFPSLPLIYSLLPPSLSLLVPAFLLLIYHFSLLLPLEQELRSSGTQELRNQELRLTYVSVPVKEEGQQSRWRVLLCELWTAEQPSPTTDGACGVVPASGAALSAQGHQGRPGHSTPVTCSTHSTVCFLYLHLTYLAHIHI